jgi:hypothetical protein
MPTFLGPDFFYDEQIRRFLLQFARIFSNFDVEYGRDEEGTNHTLIRVPVKYGDWSRQAQTVLNNNSASTMPSTPMMTFYITGLDYDRPRIQEPNFVSTIAVRQRTYDSNTDTYETTQGNAFTIDRLMPVPYKLTVNLDIWTSNTNQKFQLLEQILVLFNPALEIQSTENYIDWTSLSVCELQSTKWSSRTVPVGTDNPIDISTLTFTLPIWISSPAKVKKLGVVERIVARVFDAQGDASEAILDNDLLLGTRQVFTPYGYQALLIGNRIQALRQQQVVENGSLNPILPSATQTQEGFTVSPELTLAEEELAKIELAQTDLNVILSKDPALPVEIQNQLTVALAQMAAVKNYIQQQIDSLSTPVLPPLEESPLGNTEDPDPDPDLAPPVSPPSNLLWHSVVGVYGVLRPGISQMRLEQEDGSEVVGTIAYDPNDDRFLLFNIDDDSLPQNTLPPVDAVINPLRSGPGDGLDSALVGQRYLLTEATGSYDGASPVEWQGVFDQPLVAQANDIIEFDGAQWVVAFDSTSSPNNLQYVTNITTGIQYKWTGTAWIKSYQGLYSGGQWRLVL